MLYLVVGVVIVLAVFFVWRQVQPAQQALAVSAEPVAVGAVGTTAVVADAAPATLPKAGRIKPQQYESAFVEAGNQHLLVDVRTPQEFNSGHIAGAVNIPLQELGQRASEIPQDEPVVVYCRSGNRSSTAAKMLKNAGYDQVYDLGGVIDWQAQGLPLE